MIDFKRALNNKWLKEFETAEITSLHGGQSGIYIYRVRLDYRSYLVKVTDKVALMPQLKEEVSLMTKLQGYDFVPQTYYAYYDESIALTIREYVDGKPLNQWDLELDDLIDKCMSLLKRVHSIKVEDLKTFDDRVREARLRVIQGLVDEDDFEESYKGLSAEELFSRFEALEVTLDGAFVHGDFTLANIIYDGYSLKLIDWSAGHLSDIYADISLLVRDLRVHDLKHLKDLIKTSYGLESFDDRKVEKFVLLDEFF